MQCVGEMHLTSEIVVCENKTARDDIINSIRENKLTFKNRNNGMRR